MEVIPNNLSKTGSEVLTKELLEEVDWPEARAFWSVHIPNHEYKPWSEADFIVLTRRSILVLEVKGGVSISRDENGSWKYIDRDGNVVSRRESPIEQASSSSTAILNRLIDEFGSEIAKKFAIGLAVVFPFVNFKSIKGYEFDHRLTFDSSDFNHNALERFLKNLEKYWMEQIPGHFRGANDSELNKLRKYFRGEFQLLRPLKSYSSELSGHMLKATSRQLDYLDCITPNKSVLCEGGAGTGKTILAIETAKILEQKNLRVGFFCRNPEFANYIRSCLSPTKIRTISLDDFKGDMEGQFDSIVVDEGQDLLNIENLEMIDSMLKNGLSEGSWYWFMDMNNQSHFYPDFDPECKSFLEGVTQIILNENCRNTEPIVSFTRALTDADCGRPVIQAPGVNPKLIGGKDSVKDQAEELSNQIRQLTDDQGLAPSDISLVSFMQNEKSCIEDLSGNWRGLIGRLNHRDRDLEKIEYWDLKGFKGQENKCVVLIDLFSLSENSRQVSEIYTACSRPNHALIIIMSSKVEDFIKNKLLDSVKSE